MVRWFSFGATGALLIASILGLSFLTGSAEATDGGKKDYQIEISQFTFGPKDISVKPGDTITWINRDIAPHTATANNKSWSSPRMMQNESWTLAVTRDTYAQYFCKYHPAMKASISVAITIED